MTNPVIVPIPAKMEKYYGAGMMLHPAVEVVENAIAAIPYGKVATIDTLCQKLSIDFGTDVTCPMRTGNAIKKIIGKYIEHEPEAAVPFWRVIRGNEMLINSKHVDTCALRLKKESFKLHYTEKGDIKVLIEDGQVHSF